MFFAKVLKGLPTANEKIATVFNLGAKKQFTDTKQDLINISNTRWIASQNSLLFKWGQEKDILQVQG